MISTVGIDVDWKEKFFVLAVLVNGEEWEDAKKFVASTLRQPTMRVLDAANESDQNTFRANISDFLQGKGQIPPRK